MDINFGLDIRNELVPHSLRVGHLLIGGTTGSGKSGVINSYMFDVCPKPQVQVIGCDLKRVELPIWKDRLSILATNTAQVEIAFNWVNSIMNDRYEHMEEVGVRSWNPEWAPYIVIIADELAEIMALDEHQGNDKAQREAANLRARRLDRFGRLGRAAGILLVSCTQRPSQAVLPESYRDQHAFRLCLAVRESETGRMVLGSSIPGFDPRLIGFETPGKGYLLGQGTSPKIVRAFYVSEEEAVFRAQSFAHLRMEIPEQIAEKLYKARKEN